MTGAAPFHNGRSTQRTPPLGSIHFMSSGNGGNRSCKPRSRKRRDYHAARIQQSPPVFRLGAFRPSFDREELSDSLSPTWSSRRLVGGFTGFPFVSGDIPSSQKLYQNHENRACFKKSHFFQKNRTRRAALLRRQGRHDPGRRERLPRRNLCGPEERAYPKLIYYNRLPKGGHFAAWEQPQLFTEELRGSFRSLR